MPIEVSSGAVVFIRDDGIKYLLLYKKASPPFKESWDFPRGNIEKGESELQTAAREIKEETGISYLKFVKNFKETVEFFYRKEGKLIRKTIIYFLAETNNIEVKLSDEHDSYEWLGIDEALARLKHKTSKDILEKAHKVIN